MVNVLGQNWTALTYVGKWMILGLGGSLMGVLFLRTKSRGSFLVFTRETSLGDLVAGSVDFGIFQKVCRCTLLAPFILSDYWNYFARHSFFSSSGLWLEFSCARGFVSSLLRAECISADCRSKWDRLPEIWDSLWPMRRQHLPPVKVLNAL